VIDIHEGVNTSPRGIDSVEMDSPVMVMGRLKRNGKAGVGIEQLRTIGLVV
jgi:hypothetical protein